MTQVLAQRDGEWFLAAFAPHIRGCNLSTVQRPARNADLFHLWRGTTYVQSNAPLDGLVFYPCPRYRGMRVYPEGWKVVGSEPQLQVLLMYDEVSGGGEEATRARVEALESDGWVFNGDDGGRRSVRLCELERVEGPPPTC